MFDQDTWRACIAERLSSFARNPRQDIHITGAASLLAYLAVGTLQPFLEAYQHEPITAVLTLAEITRGPGANLIVRRAGQMRYQVARLIERELRTRPEVRAAVEQLFIGLQVITLARQRLNSSRDEWFRTTLLVELDGFTPGEFAHLRRELVDAGWHSRYETIRSLRSRNGHYSTSDLVLLHDGLSDSASHVRAAAARMLGQFAGTPPTPLVKALTRVALYDCDLETRFAAARTLGALRDRIASPQLIDYLGQCLVDEDSFVRSAAALALGQLGELAGVPTLISRLTQLLSDSDVYAREAAARALGRIGAAAATTAVFNALTRAVEDADANVHEAAVESLRQLRKVRATLPLNSSRFPSEPLMV